MPWRPKHGSSSLSSGSAPPSTRHHLPWSPRATNWPTRCAPTSTGTCSRRSRYRQHPPLSAAARPRLHGRSQASSGSHPTPTSSDADSIPPAGGSSMASRWPMWPPSSASMTRPTSPAGSVDSSGRHQATSGTDRCCHLALGIGGPPGGLPGGPEAADGSGPSALCDLVGEAIVRLERATDHAGGQRALEVVNRGELAPDGHLRAPTEVLERHRVHRGAVVEAGDVEDLSLDDPLERDNLEILALERGILAACGVVDPAPPTAGPDVHLLDRRGVAMRPPPVGHPLWIVHDLPNELTRGIEDPLDHQLSAFCEGRCTFVAKILSYCHRALC